MPHGLVQYQTTHFHLRLLRPQVLSLRKEWLRIQAEKTKNRPNFNTGSKINYHFGFSFLLIITFKPLLDKHLERQSLVYCWSKRIGEGIMESVNLLVTAINKRELKHKSS